MKKLLIATSLLASSSVMALGQPAPANTYQRICNLDGEKVVIKTILFSASLRSKYPITGEKGQAFLTFGENIPEQGEYFKDSGTKRWSWGALVDGVSEFSLQLKGNKLSFSESSKAPTKFGTCLPSTKVLILDPYMSKFNFTEE